MTIPYDAGRPLSCADIRAVDQYAIEQLGLPGIALMENASRAVAEFVFGQLADPTSARVVFLCGSGNNGGDGFAAARHLHLAGVYARCVLAAPAERLAGDAACNHGVALRMGIPVLDAEAGKALLGELGSTEVVVDALLGTGARGAPRGVAGELIELANASAARRVAIDIPSGLDGDSGAVHEPCFRADATVTFVAAKLGFATESARAVLGDVVVVGIGAPLGGS